MDKNNWFDVSLRKFSEISILNILEKLDYKSHKLLYRFNDASWDKNDINNPLIKNIHPNYGNTNIFNEKNLRLMTHDFSHEFIFGRKIPMLNYSWYEIQPCDVVEFLNPIKHGSLNVLITDDVSNINNYLFYVNVYEAIDLVFAINFNNIQLQKQEYLEKYIQQQLFNN